MGLERIWQIKLGILVMVRMSVVGIAGFKEVVDVLESSGNTTTECCG